ncbi:alkanesulfonate monooxygenase [Mesorhizobium albiziae]|uniref:Alkanesulfonate monooxygenase n=1 Tax=Neomesorhizobium albiziae TaxID=335020 RepID=A0A1I3WFI5_9HYPH|nr:LLM class flavin-dependent oxidoreductase [Mesorhizobium albiziae]GLS31527.1 alkanesulfonate monooxygenase [Mesorhizobium albiziae]SFK05201.1 alkanesulfonate monooxygenase [Mesorhizobium albiziae]
MHIEFIGHTANLSLSKNEADAAIDREGLRRLAQLAEASGIDRLAVGGLAAGQDIAALASFIVHSTASLGVFLHHRIGAVAPTVAAQHLATLDQLSGGRVAVEFQPERIDGVEGHEEGLARVDEYLVLLKRLWTNEKPIDHEGSHYSVSGAFTAAKPFQRGGIPFSLAGLSGTAIKVAARHADIFALPAATVDETRQTIARVRAAAACHRRADAIRFSYPLRPVVAATREAAWAKLDRTAGNGQRRPGFIAADPFMGGTNPERFRLQATAPSPASQPAATTIVGTAEQVALAFLDYVDIGVSDFHLHGFETAEELAGFGRSVAPLVRRAVARHDAHKSESYVEPVPDRTTAAFRRRYSN